MSAALIAATASLIAVNGMGRGSGTPEVDVDLIVLLGFGSILAVKALVLLMILSIPSLGYCMWREDGDPIVVVLAAVVAPMLVVIAWGVLAAAGHGLIWIFGA